MALAALIQSKFPNLVLSTLTDKGDEVAKTLETLVKQLGKL